MSKLEGVKIGDKLVVRRYSTDADLCTVTRVGKVHVVVSDGRKFRFDGFEAGDYRYSSGTARIATVQDEENFERRSITQRLCDREKTSKVSIENLRAFWAIVEAAQ
jgi:hypothetical protein